MSRGEDTGHPALPTLATVRRMSTTSVALRRQLSPGELDAVKGLLDAASVADGQRPMGDQAWLDLLHGVPGSSTLLARGSGHGLSGVAQLSRLPHSWTLEVAVHPDHRGTEPAMGPETGPETGPPTAAGGHESVSARLVAAALDVVARDGSDPVDYWIPMIDEQRDHEARAAGFRPERDLLQLRRPLPVPSEYRGGAPEIALRPFRRNQDEEIWLRVNNRAFVDHPEQGAWRLEHLREREQEPWFDPEGFLLHWREGSLAGSCWTKIHHETEPKMGEIYVISVNPEYQGLGLGRSLTLAGLDWLAGRGLEVGMLYVDADNEPARALYDSLGFGLHHTDREFRLPGAHPDGSADAVRDAGRNDDDHDLPES